MTTAHRTGTATRIHPKKSTPSDNTTMDHARLHQLVIDALNRQPITDPHTHCYAPRFGASPQPGGLLLWGIDELVTYHYLVAEVYRVVPPNRHRTGRQKGLLLPYRRFWQMSKPRQADHIWKHLFVEQTPISEACRGVLTTLDRLGLDPNEPTLEPYRHWFAQQNPETYVDRVMALTNIDQLTMTNPVFDDHERQIWLDDPTVGRDPRFRAVLRIDPLLRDWTGACEKLRAWGFDARPDFSGRTADHVQRFLRSWIKRMRATYVAISLPPEFRFPDPDHPEANRFLRDCLMPVCAEQGLVWALMIGARLRVNPALQDAGDTVGKADVMSVINLCHHFDANKFMVTMLSRENQHELCVAARKFSNLMVFGCWWFLNNPSIVEEMTRERLELLGTSFIPQHSDARILDQLVYKWDHSRRVIADVLTDKYADLAATGFRVTARHIKRDVARLLRNNYRDFLER